MCGRGTPERCPGDLLSRVDGVLRMDPLPSSADVDRGLAEARRLGARTVLGLGGGSAMDAAKSIAVAAGYVDRLADLEGLPDRPRRVRLVQVPTTAGTGSEVTRWASLWEDGRKGGTDRAAGYADLALVDPGLTASMSPRLTLSTGLDALSHAVESLWGIYADPVADLYAEEALRLLRGFLPSVLAGPEADNREGMARASLLAGMALSHTRTAAAHALSYHFTGRLGLEHGLATGLLCGALLPWTARQAPRAAERIQSALGLAHPEALLDWVRERCAQAGVGGRLSDHGIGEGDLADAIGEAGGSDRLANHPGHATEGDLRTALERIA